MTIAAFRHNNPFDVSLPIAGWKGAGNVVGVQGQAGYGSFPDMQTGYAAGVHRLNSYITGQSSHGPLQTINDLNTVYATDPNWKNGVAKFSGIAGDAKLDPNDPAQMAKLQYGVLAQEIGPENAAKVIQGQGGTPPTAPAAPTDPFQLSVGQTATFGQNAPAATPAPANGPLQVQTPPVTLPQGQPAPQQAPQAPLQLADTQFAPFNWQKINFAPRRTIAFPKG